MKKTNIGKIASGYLLGKNIRNDSRIEPKKGKVISVEMKGYAELDWCKATLDNGEIINLDFFDTFYIEESCSECSECSNNMTGNFCSNCGRDLRE